MKHIHIINDLFECSDDENNSIVDNNDENNNDDNNNKINKNDNVEDDIIIEYDSGKKKYNISYMRKKQEKIFKHLNNTQLQYFINIMTKKLESNLQMNSTINHLNHYMPVEIVMNNDGRCAYYAINCILRCLYDNITFISEDFIQHNNTDIRGVNFTRQYFQDIAKAIHKDTKHPWDILVKKSKNTLVELISFDEYMKIDIYDKCNEQTIDKENYFDYWDSIFMYFKHHLAMYVITCPEKEGENLYPYMQGSKETLKPIHEYIDKYTKDLPGRPQKRTSAFIIYRNNNHFNLCGKRNHNGKFQVVFDDSDVNESLLQEFLILANEYNCPTTMMDLKLKEQYLKYKELSNIIEENPYYIAENPKKRKKKRRIS